MKSCRNGNTHDMTHQGQFRLIGRLFFHLLQCHYGLRVYLMTLFVRFQILLLSALSAHSLAGGTFVETPNLLWQSFSIGVVLFCFRSIKLEGPALALLILFIRTTLSLLYGLKVIALSRFHVYEYECGLRWIVARHLSLFHHI